MSDPVNRDNLRELASERSELRSRMDFLFEAAGLRPGISEWRRGLRVLSLSLGATLLLAGIVFFFAYNWEALGRFQKLGLIEAGMVVAVGVAWFRGLDSISGKISLFSAAMLIGVFWAVFGQIYQTGADAWQLFVSWSILVTPWVLIGRFPSLWALWLVLLNLSGWGYVDQEILVTEYSWNSALPELVIFAISGLFVFGWESAKRWFEWTRIRWLPRLAALVAIVFVTFATMQFVTSFPDESSISSSFYWATVLYLVMVGFCLWYYRFVRFDLFLLASVHLSVIVVLTAELASDLFTELESFFLLGLIILGLVSGSVTILNRQREAVKSEDVV